MNSKPMNELPFLDPTGHLTSHLSSALLFAARYAHHRNTGASMLVVQALRQVWSFLPPAVRNTLIRESGEATHNQEDWHLLKEFEVKPTGPFVDTELHQRLDALIADIAKLRDLIFEDASDMMQGALASSPEECLYFARQWILRKQGKTVEAPSSVFADNETLEISEEQPAMDGTYYYRTDAAAPWRHVKLHSIQVFGDNGGLVRLARFLPTGDSMAAGSLIGGQWTKLTEK